METRVLARSGPDATRHDGSRASLPRMRSSTAVGLLVTVLAACGPGSPGGPSMNNRVSSDEPSEEAPAIQSNDILARDARANHTKVQHILVSWKGRMGEGEDARAKSRTRAQADALAQQLLERARAGESFEHLMSEFSEDRGSADDGMAYDVAPDEKLVFEFKRLGLRLDVGEFGLVLSQFGWHIMKRVE